MKNKIILLGIFIATLIFVDKTNAKENSNKLIDSISISCPDGGKICARATDGSEWHKGNKEVKVY